MFQTIQSKSEQDPGHRNAKQEETLHSVAPAGPDKRGGNKGEPNRLDSLLANQMQRRMSEEGMVGFMKGVNPNATPLSQDPSKESENLNDSDVLAASEHDEEKSEPSERILTSQTRLID